MLRAQKVQYRLLGKNNMYNTVQYLAYFFTFFFTSLGVKPTTTDL